MHAGHQTYSLLQANNNNNNKKKKETRIFNITNNQDIHALNEQKRRMFLTLHSDASDS